jgi:glutamine amidotransferase
MTASTVLVDYGVGNLLSAKRALEACNAQVEVTGDPIRVAKADRVVLPGVGAFGDCVKELESRGLTHAVQEFARTQRPLLGICVGMQVLMEYGEEFGRHPGLGLIAGGVLQIPDVDTAGQPLKLPHIGWTELRYPPSRNSWSGTVFANLDHDPSVYFVHSFAARPANPSDILAQVDYGGHQVVAAVSRGAVSGTQFHPEKSGPVGLAILSSFLAL